MINTETEMRRDDAEISESLLSEQGKRQRKGYV